jgi:parvulin-like peptidyl-prolyl isomerase
LALALGFLLLTHSCRKEQSTHPHEHALVEVYRGQSTSGALVATVSAAEYRQALARTRLEREGHLHAAHLPPELKERVLEDLIDRRLLSTEARSAGVRVSTAAVEAKLESMRTSLTDRELRKRLIDTFQTEQDLRRLIFERMTAGALVAKSAHEGVEVTDDEIREVWKGTSPEMRKLPERVHASQIVVRTQEEGDEVVKLLKKRKGPSFAELAEKRSVGPEADRGGDLGWFQRGTMPQLFDDICFALKPGEISKLTASDYGFHVFKVHRRERERALSFDEARERIHSELLTKKLSEAERNYVRSLRTRFHVVKDNEVLASIE